MAWSIQHPAIYPDPPFASDDVVWVEKVELTEPGGSEFSLNASRARAVVRLKDWTMLRSFIRRVLGFSWGTESSPWRLQRENPLWHPVYPWLIADSISVQGLGPWPKYKPESQEWTLKIEEPLYKNWSATRYKEALITVNFVDVPWNILSDESIEWYGDEIYRNVFFDVEPSVEMISSEGGYQLELRSANAQVQGKKVPAPFGTLMHKTTFILNWMYVPHNYISDDPNVLIPKNILKCVGKVNSTDFGPFPKGTLLMQPPRFRRFRFPITSTNDELQFFGYNIQIPLQYFDPSRDPLDIQADPNYPRGHNLMPFRYTMKWYKALRVQPNGNASGTLLEEIDFHEIFRHVKDT